MDNGTLALILAPLVGLVTGLVTALVTRKGNTEANETDRFEVLLSGYDARIRTLESEVKDLRAADVEKSLKISELTRVNNSLNRYVRKLLKFIADNTKLEAPQPDESIV
jgi:hypothetical protein